jgi:hypothetical protein
MFAGSGDFTGFHARLDVSIVSGFLFFLDGTQF